MHFSAIPDKPAASSCVICAKQIPDRDQVCPYCGQGPFIEESAADDDWPSAGSASDEATSDPVLEAMMAIASSTPKTTPAESVPSVLVAPSEQITVEPRHDANLEGAQPSTTQPQALAHPPPSSPAWRMVFGAAVMSMSAALTGAQLQSGTPAVVHRQDATPAAPYIAPAAQALASAPVPAERDDRGPPAEALPAPDAEAPSTVATTAPDNAPRSAACSEALLALALCREPL